MAGKAAKARLQLNVDEDLAARIDKFAKALNRSTSWMVAELLVQAIKERQRFVDWLAWRMIRMLGGADPRNLAAMFAKSSAEPPKKATVYLQAQVSQELAESLDAMADAQQRTRADMAAQLLCWAVDDSEFILKLVQTSWLNNVYDALKLPRGMQSAANREENLARDGGNGEQEQQPAGEVLGEVRAAG